LSSDLLLSNYYPLALIVLNIFITEIVIALKLRLFMWKRKEIYFGLVVSMIVGCALPWKFVSLNSSNDYKTRINSGFYHYIFVFIVFFLGTFVMSLFQTKAVKEKDDKSKNKKDKDNNKKIM
jgi:hypothetical protein